MPPARTTSVGANRNTRPFKPPSRISNGGANTATIRKSKNAPSRIARQSNGESSRNKAIDSEASSIESEDEDEDVIDTPRNEAGKSRQSIRSTAPTTPRRRSTAVAAGAEDDPLALIEDEEAPVIPRPLLTRILFEGFEDKGMKINKEAMSVVELYTRIFIKEAIARSKQETREQAQKMGTTGGMIDDWLNVEDLEKVAPQLILDF
jgi:CENP-S associating Centromere protein X